MTKNIQNDQRSIEEEKMLGPINTTLLNYYLKQSMSIREIARELEIPRLAVATRLIEIIDQLGNKEQSKFDKLNALKSECQEVLDESNT